MTFHRRIELLIGAVFASVAFFLVAVTVMTYPAKAGGLYELFPDAAITGIENVPMDTNLSQGRQPQTAKTTTSALRDFVLGGGTVAGAGTATATAGAATLNNCRGTVTSEAITTAAAADYVLTLTSSCVAATSIVLVSVSNGTNTTEGIAANRVQPAAGSVVVRVRNTNASAALNGTIQVRYVVIN